MSNKKILAASVAAIFTFAALVGLSVFEGIKAVQAGEQRSKPHDYLGIVVVTDAQGGIKAAIPVNQESVSDDCYNGLAVSMSQHADQISNYIANGLRVSGYCVDLSRVENPLVLKPGNGKDESDKTGVDPGQLAKPRTPA
jgi:hypothetical protein